MKVSTRLGFWVVGVVLGTGAAWCFRTILGPGAVVVAFAAGLLLAGLIGELAHALRSLAKVPDRTVPPPGAAPADGEVEIIGIEGVARVPNRVDPRFSAFRDFCPTRSSTDPDATLPQGRALPPLLGKVAMLSVFLGRDGRSWSDAEIARTHAALIRAGEWIEREAMRWDAHLNLGVAETYFVVDDEASSAVEMTFVAEGEGVGPFEAGASTKTLIAMSRAASRLGFHDAVDWMAWVRPRIQADVLVWLLHPRSSGRSLAIPLDQTELAGVSLAVCYARETSFPEPLLGPPFTDPVTIAHELMHLFGASDKYGQPLNRFPPRSVSSRDIMRLSETRLPRLRVDPGTASEIGWPSVPCPTH